MFGSPIHDVEVAPLRRIPDERGTILHMMRVDDPHFRAFGEIYFTTIYPGVIKGWHKHRDMTLNYAVPVGRIKLVIYDDRPESSTRGALMELFPGQDDYSLVVIPPGLWNGFKGMGDPFSLVANCCTHPHDPTRTIRVDPQSPEVPYDWTVRHS